MKKLLCTILLFSSFSLFASQDIFRIEIGKRDSSSDTQDLRQRVWMLEQAVRQLQDKVFQLEYSNANRPSPVASKQYTCTLQNNMAGTFTSTKGSMGEAKADVIKQCTDKNSSNFFCKKKDVECSE